ncbi:hypothetical protein SAMN05192552_101934 [Natrinema hispanicum]|uniref:DUF2795 domain-containing protein n=1 Tax=Natrinema hispanicum TaxID=392421 RepID=A0A1I0IAS9_9EURY|nr:hypothetical protein SAMN05192552_101934 [Natrinema hispanicum]SET93690.1 hypothetical protein SAMN04488694_11833 [Natrinema hispanicum]
MFDTDAVHSTVFCGLHAMDRHSWVHASAGQPLFRSVTIPPPVSNEHPDRDRVQNRAEQRQADRADHTESIFDAVERDLGDLEYPVTSEELATEYATEPIDIPSETESIGSVFDRLVDEQYDSPAAVREAAYGELTGEADSPNEANLERDLDELDDENAGSVSERGGDTD